LCGAGGRPGGGGLPGSSEFADSCVRNGLTELRDGFTSASKLHGGAR